MATFLSVAPHPDDEVLGAGVVSRMLLEAGHAVHVYCASLGRPDQHGRRAAEAADAAAIGGWALHLPKQPAAIGGGDDLVAAHQHLVEQISSLEVDGARSLGLAGAGVPGGHGGRVCRLVAEPGPACPGRSGSMKVLWRGRSIGTSELFVPST